MISAPVNCRTVAEVADTVGLLAWLHRDALLTGLNNEIEALGGNDAGALTAEDQAGRIAELSRQLTILKRQIEQLHDRAEADGLIVTGRDFSDAAIVLGVECP